MGKPVDCVVVTQGFHRVVRRVVLVVVVVGVVLVETVLVVVR